jgi:protein-tyrosine phosphatase
MAEGIFLSLLRQSDLEQQFRVDSCGTGSWHVGDLPDPRTRAIARKYGFELPSRARQLRLSDFEEFDYLFAMDGQNLRDIQALAPIPDFGQSPSIQKLRDFDPLAPGADVPDPYMGGPEAFEAVYEMLLRSCTELLAQISPSPRR